MIPAVVDSIQPLTGDVFLIRLVPELPVRFQSGQYMKVLVPAGDGGGLIPIPISVASPPELSYFEFLVRPVEKSSPASWLIQQAPGSRLSIQGPFGKLAYVSSLERQVCFVSHGTGIAPHRSIFYSESFQKNPPKLTTFLTGFRHEADVIAADLATMGRAARHWVTLSGSVGPEWKGLRGRVTDHLKSDILGLHWGKTDFYLCGSREMITDCKNILASRGVRPEAIHHE